MLLGVRVDYSSGGSRSHAERARYEEKKNNMNPNEYFSVALLYHTADETRRTLQRPSSRGDSGQGYLWRGIVRYGSRSELYDQYTAQGLVCASQIVEHNSTTALHSIILVQQQRTCSDDTEHTTDAGWGGQITFFCVSKKQNSRHVSRNRWLANWSKKVRTFNLTWT